MREMRNADCGIAARLSPLSSCTAWFQALLAICNSAFRNPHFLRISSRLSPVATALDLGLVSSSFGNFAIRNPQSAIRNPHFLRILTEFAKDDRPPRAAKQSAPGSLKLFPVRDEAARAPAPYRQKCRADFPA